MERKEKLILLVEDNKKIMSGNTRIFKKEGYDTAVSQTLREAWDFIDVIKPDLIVLDINLPDGSGYDFMTRLKESENAKIPVLMMTDRDTEKEIISDLKAAGGNYLKKPYDYSDLLLRAKALLND